LKLAIIVGSCVSTIKQNELKGCKLLLVQDYSIIEKRTVGHPYVAVDTVGAGVGETVDAADQLGHRVVTRHLIGDRLRIHVGEMPRRADDRHEGKEILLGGENNRVEKLAVRGAAHEDAETAKLEKESVTLSPAMRPRDGAQIVTPLPYLGTIQRHTHPCRRGVHLLARILATGPSSLLPCGQCTDTTGSVCVPRVEHLRFARGSPATQRLTRTVRTNHQRAHNPSGSNGV